MPKIHRNAVHSPTTPAAKPSSKPVKPETRQRSDAFVGKPLEVRQPVRDGHELDVVWRSVRIVEGQVAGRNPPWDALVNNPHFKGGLANDLRNFVSFGKSSLTPYEARLVGNGLGYRDVGGHTYGNTPVTKNGYTRGDRVEITLPDEHGQPSVHRGIIADIDHSGELRVLSATADGFRLDRTPDAKIITPALNDGRS